MKTYLYCLVTHIIGLLLVLAGGILSVQHHLFFCTTASVIIAAGLSYSLYRIQIRQTQMLRRIIECMKRGDLALTAHAPFSDRAMQEMATEMSVALSDLRRKLTEEETKLQYYESLLGKVDTAVVLTDSQGHSEWMNQAARQLLGESGQLPETILSALHEHKQVVQFTREQTTSDLSLAATRIYLQGRERWIVSLKNIRPALERTEMEAWQKLIRVLTHEIMNSITPIISLAETLSERNQESAHDPRMQAQVQQGLAVIHRRSKGLLEFVENYRKLTRIAPPVKTKFQIKALFADLQRLYPEPTYQFLNPGEGLFLYADRPQMEQVFINLLKNAGEACNGVPSPAVSVAVEEKPDQLLFTITDNGEGMLPEVTERIFVPFFTTKPTGSGIGLSLCKQIITFHGGQISVRSSIGSGSTFTISLPR